MSSPRSSRVTRASGAVAVATLALVLTGAPDPVSARAPLAGADLHDASAAVRPSGVGTSAGASRTANSHGTWSWPVPGARTVLRGYEAPASRYSAGHRGIDIAAVTGTPVVSPASGTVRFAGVVVDRPTITVATVDGVLISLEPVASPLAAGDVVAGGQSLGRVAAGGHCNAACLHLGVRVNGDYASPLLFFGGVPRAVLLPLN